MGLSVLCPPAGTPIMALQVPVTVFLVPEGSLILVLFPSSVCPMMTAELPEALAKAPLSPTLSSQLEMMVPSGMVLTGRMLPTERVAE